jgi:protein involved in sex pheromone biosynthesis
MKKTNIILIILLTLFLIGCSNIKNSQDNIEIEKIEENIYSGSCPKGLINDTYPGECGQYIDKNQDNICDRSQ